MTAYNIKSGSSLSSTNMFFHKMVFRLSVHPHVGFFFWSSVLLLATNHYDDCLSPFLRYNKRSKEAKKYHQQLEVLKNIYRNECLCLLEDVVEHEVAY